MSVNHAVSDLVAMIRNGYLAKRGTISSPISKLREDILKILKEEGYISSYSKLVKDKKFNINLKYHLSRPVISEIEVLSKPGKRVYSNVNDIPLIRNGLGVIIISTSKGVVADSVARTNNVGGELLLKVF
jgi:small subunit ribosomal protein S8